MNVRSRGLSPNAVRVIAENDVTWADLILVMENRHRTMLIERFADVVDRERVHEGTAFTREWTGTTARACGLIEGAAMALDVTVLDLLWSLDLALDENR